MSSMHFARAMKQVQRHRTGLAIAKLTPAANIDKTRTGCMLWHSLSRPFDAGAGRPLMFTVRIGMSEQNIAGSPRIELKRENGQFITLDLRKPGHTLELPLFVTPPPKFKLDIAYWL